MSDQIDWKARVEEMKRRAETIRTDEPDTWPFPDEAIANDYAALLSRITELEAEPDWKARALKAEGEVERLKSLTIPEMLPFWPWLWADPFYGRDDQENTRAMAETRIRVNYETAREPIPNQYALVHRADIQTLIHELWSKRARSTLYAEQKEALQSKLTRLVEVCRPFAELLQAWEGGHHKPPSEVGDGETVPGKWITVGSLRTLSEALEGGDGSSVAKSASEGLRPFASESHSHSGKED